MTIANTGSLFTPDDLLQMEDAVNFELVDGKLVERHMGMESTWNISGRSYCPRKHSPLCRRRTCGWAWRRLFDMGRYGISGGTSKQ